jgi:hypothetical protein
MTQVTDLQELADAGYPVEAFSQNSYPCMFKLGNAFFDFTPFKLASNVWPAVWLNYTDTAAGSLDNSYQYQFTWCTPLTESLNATCLIDAYVGGAYANGTDILLNGPDSVLP